MISGFRVMGQMKTLGEIGENRKIPTESSIDKILGGGVEKKGITQFYGPPGSGKTNIAIKLAVETARKGKKAFFIDTEGGISVERIRQVSGEFFDTVAENIIVFEPSSFTEQEKSSQGYHPYLRHMANQLNWWSLILPSPFTGLRRVKPQI